MEKKRVLGRMMKLASRRCPVNCYGKRIKYCTSVLEKVSYFQGSSDVPLLGFTIGQVLRNTTEKYPDKTAISFSKDNISLTYEQFFIDVGKLAAGFISLGYKKGDRIGIWAPNCLEWVLTQYATSKIGVILVSVNPAYEVNELEYAMKLVGMRGIICPVSYKLQNYYEKLLVICPELASIKSNVVNSPRLPALNHVILLGANVLPGTLTFSDVFLSGTSADVKIMNDIEKKLQFDDQINIQFTSGTTGNPKGATLTHHMIVNNAYFVGNVLGYNKQPPKICVPVPLYHCFGMTMASLSATIHGGQCVYPSPTFEAVSVLESVHKERCTSLYGTPTMFIDILTSYHPSQYDLSSLSTGIMAGSVCPEETMKELIEKLHISEITICYGTTETSPVSFQTYRNDSIETRCTTIGKPHPHTEVKVVDENGNIVPVNTIGELCVRGYSVMKGYWDNLKATNEVIKEDRWYHSGDLVSIDEKGYGKIKGRSKDMIIRGGENIYPTEIEQFLYTHPAILEAQVIGVPSKRLGEEVCVWIKLKDGMKLDENDVREFCKSKISYFKIPRHILFVQDFPMTVTGKIKKYKMREETIAFLKCL